MGEGTLSRRVSGPGRKPGTSGWDIPAEAWKRPGCWSAKDGILVRGFRSKQVISPGRPHEAMDQRIRTPLGAGERLAA
jgi:hypothetical protein